MSNNKTIKNHCSEIYLFQNTSERVKKNERFLFSNYILIYTHIRQTHKPFYSVNAQIPSTYPPDYIENKLSHTCT